MKNAIVTHHTIITLLHTLDKLKDYVVLIQGGVELILVVVPLVPWVLMDWMIWRRWQNNHLLLPYITLYLLVDDSDGYGLISDLVYMLGSIMLCFHTTDHLYSNYFTQAHLIPVVWRWCLLCLSSIKWSPCVGSTYCIGVGPYCNTIVQTHTQYMFTISSLFYTKHQLQCEMIVITM